MLNAAWKLYFRLETQILQICCPDLFRLQFGTQSAHSQFFQNTVKIENPVMCTHLARETLFLVE